MENNLKNRREAEFVRIDGNICTYRWPDTGEEFTTIAEFVPNIDMTRHKVKMLKVIVQWLEGIPRTKQLAQLKMVYPQLKTVPNNKLLAMIKDGHEWEIGEFLIDEAEKFVKEGEKVGLKIRTVEVTEVTNN